MRARCLDLGIALAVAFACCVAATARAQDAQASGSSGDAPAAATAGLGWGLAPLRWRGLIATELRSLAAQGQPRQVHRVDSGQVQVSSYVWQPWFAQVEGGVGAVSSSERGASGARSASLTGNGMLNVFPSSRFPFQASFDASDSRTADQATGESFQSRRWGVRQSHRSLSGDEQSAAGYNRSTLHSRGFGRDVLDVLNGSHSRRLGLHGLDSNADLTRNRREGSDEHAQFMRLFGRHGWSDSGLASLDTTASYGASDLRLASAGAPVDSRNEFFQLNNFFTWRREEDDPLYVTGGARYFHAAAQGSGTPVDSRSAMAHAGAAYRASANLLLNAGASATRASSSGGPSALLTTQSGGASYTADPRRLGAHLYTVTAGATALNQTGLASGARRLVSGQAGHNVQRIFQPAPAQSVTATLVQTLGESRDSIAGALHTLTHNASVAWRAARGEELTGLLGASAADSRTGGHTDSAFQLLNAQASGQAQLGRYASLSGNLTLQATRQASGGAPLGPFALNINGGLAYQHQRALGVRGLRYLATYDRNDYRLNTRLEGDLTATRAHVTASFEQRLEYRIGKLLARLSLRLAEVDGKESAFVFFRLARELGD